MRPTVMAVCLAATLAGCTNMRLHDEGRSKLAAETKEQYAKADVPGILDVEAKNLDALLDESLKVARENHALQLDLALLSIAADRTAMASTLQEAADGLTALGFAVKSGDFGAVRAQIIAWSERTLRSEETQRFARFIALSARLDPPPCEADGTLPEFADWSKDLKLSELQRKQAGSNYRAYREACEKLKSAARNVKYGNGLLKSNETELETAIGSRSARESEVMSQKSALKAAREEYSAALGEGKSPEARCADKQAKLADNVKEKLDQLKKVIDVAEKLDPSLAGEERIASLLTLLEAAAGESVDPEDANLKKAARVALELPSLLADMCELTATKKKPAVSNLLLGLRHQTLLADYAQQQKELADQRIVILRERQTLLREQAKQWLAFVDANCSFAALSAGQGHPSEKCSSFKALAGGEQCELGGKPLAGTCALSKPWSAHLRASPGPATREIYKALLAYQRVYALRARDSEIAFRLVDAFHRETLARKRFAVKDWDNLVGSAVAQLDAYFAAGLKPAEIADLIVKALGFTAIAIGVSN